MADGLVLAGSAGLGAVWGWLAARLRPRPRTVAAALVATVLPWAAAWAFGGLAGAVAFAIAVVAALLLHSAAREGWRRQAAPLSPQRRPSRRNGDSGGR